MKFFFIIVSLILSVSAIASEKYNDSIFGEWTCTIRVRMVCDGHIFAQYSGTHYLKGIALKHAIETPHNYHCPGPGIDNIPDDGKEFRDKNFDDISYCTYSCTEEKYYYLDVLGRVLERLSD